VDGDKVTAEFRHGVLTITLPKRKEAKARRIEAKAT
jgi:HSP20 family molecular chaperone IbpA